MSHRVLSSFLDEERGFRYAIANETFGDAIIDVLSESFPREPVSAALGLSAGDLAPLVARFIPECMKTGLSVIALPADHSGTLAGAFICRDFRSPLPEGVPGEFPWFSPIAEALTNIDEAYEAKRPGLVLGERSISGWREFPHTVNSPGKTLQVLSSHLTAEVPDELDLVIDVDEAAFHPSRSSR